MRPHPISGGDAQDDWWQCRLCNRVTTDDTVMDEDSCHPRCKREFFEDNPNGIPVPKFPTGDPIFEGDDEVFISSSNYHDA